MWNRIARTVAEQRGLGLWESARLLGVLNFAVADATISVYAEKYVYNFWRPLTAIRNADVDGNPDTDADPDWTSLLTASNHPDTRLHTAIKPLRRPRCWPRRLAMTYRSRSGA